LCEKEDKGGSVKMGQSCKLSIVIPVYNAEKYLCQCLDSVLNQSLHEIEVICVDDGSTDHSLEILKQYEKADSRVRVLRQENLYAGVARNTGLAVAVGEYVHFLDADDYVLDYAYEVLYSKAVKHNLDYLSFAAIPYDVQLGQMVWSPYYMLERLDSDDFNRLVDAQAGSPVHQVSVAPWSAIYRCEFLREKDLHFNDLFCVNDKSFFYAVITNAQRMMIARDRLVVHRINMSDSLVGVRAKHFDCHFKSLQILMERLARDLVPESVQTAVIQREFKDTMGWYEKFQNDLNEGEKIKSETERFVKNIKGPYADMIMEIYQARLKKIADGPAEEPAAEIVSFPVPACPEPKVSVVVPVYNAEDYLSETLHCLLSQTLREVEFIFIDDGSTDSSSVILREYAAVDKRIQVFRQENAGAGAARNTGFQHVSGKYTYFFDADDLCDPYLLEMTVEKAEETKADIVAFHFNRFYPDGRKESRRGIDTGCLPEGIDVFNYSDCPGRIMNIINPTPWNKLYRTEFIRKHQLHYEEISSSNDITFCAVSAASADRIAFITKELVSYRWGHEGTITSGKSDKLPNILHAVSSALKQAESLPYYEEISGAVQYFAISQYIYGLYHNISDITLPLSRAYYESIRDFFLGPQFDGLERETLGNDVVYNRFCIVRKHDYDTFCKLKSRRLVVSLTSFPERIKGITAVLETIYQQTHLPDEIVLWLAEEQFPGRMGELPDELRRLVEEGRLTLEWCDDLKPHKKYFYAFQKYVDDIIVTIDDDLLYAPDLLEKLYDSYLLYPDAVSAARTHLIAVTSKGEILPYKQWIRETDCSLYEPSMQICATGGAGCLYPPHILDQRLLDKEVLMEICPYADDLWIKTMELLSDVPVAAALSYAELEYLPGSQEVSLKTQNLYADGNDDQLRKIIAWVESRYGKDVFSKKLISEGSGAHIVGDSVFWKNLSLEREKLKGRIRNREIRLEEANVKRREFYEQWKKAGTDRDHIKAERNRLKRERDRLKAELEDLKKIQKESACIRTEVFELLNMDRAVKAELKENLKDSIAKRADFYERLEYNREKLKKAEEENVELGKKLQRAGEENSRLSKRLEESDAKRTEFYERLQYNRSELQKISEEKAELERELAKLRAEQGAGGLIRRLGRKLKGNGR